MIRSITFVAVIAFVACCSTTAMAQGTGGTGTGGTGTGTGTGTGGAPSADLPTLDIGGNFSDTGGSSAFTDNRRATGQTSAAQRGAATGQGGLSGPGGVLSQLFGGGQFTAPSTARRQLRAPLRVEFDVIRPESTQVANVLQNRFTQIAPIREGGSDISVQVVNRVATLSGSVATERQKEMAERMTRLEPGVSTVVNQITIRGK